MLEPLVASLDDTDGWVRSVAVKALKELRDIRAAEPLMHMLKDPDTRTRQEAAGALVSLGWQPSDDVQRAYLAGALQKWEDLGMLGASAIAPLVLEYKSAEQRQRVHLREKSPAERALLLIEKILELVAMEIAPDDLRAVADLQNLTQLRYFVVDCGADASPGREDQVDTSGVKQLARQELIRRGLEA